VEVRGKTFSIIGAARSGRAVARLLQKRGARVFVSDKASAADMQEAVAELAAFNIPSEFGGTTERVLSAEVLVVSPGVPSDVPIVQRARARGIKIVSELEAASWFCNGPMIAVTGTNGKTTTTALLGRMFDDAKRPAVVAGNIGDRYIPAAGGDTLEHHPRSS
jgi:UDP-N-acetylmuramoylalanine--D-glutamate ligase